MDLSEAKKKMIHWKDFYGGDLLDFHQIKKAKNKAQLAEILDNHVDFMESMLSDALSHLENFRKEIGASKY